MCLQHSTFKKLNNEKGIGWKFVRQISDTEFKPEYDVFAISNQNIRSTGTAGVRMNDYKQFKFKYNNGILIKLIYKINRWYRVKHKRTTKTYIDNNLCPSSPPYEYPAGVCLYKTPPGYGYYLKCQYSHAIAEDNQVIVAMAIKPLSYEYYGKHYND